MIRQAVLATLVLSASCRAAPLGPSVTLRGGVVMPSVGLGSSGGCHPDPDGTERAQKGYASVVQAMGVGFRSFHDALSYGNQACLGVALKDAVAAKNVTRKEVFIMSMVPKYLMGYKETKASIAASLAQLQVLLLLALQPLLLALLVLLALLLLLPLLVLLLALTRGCCR